MKTLSISPSWRRFLNCLMVYILISLSSISLGFSQNRFSQQSYDTSARGFGQIILIDTMTMKGHLLTYYDKTEQVSLTIFWPGEANPPLVRNASKLLRNGGMIFLPPSMLGFCGIRESFLLSGKYRSILDFSGAEPPLESTELDLSRGKIVKVTSVTARFLVGITEAEILLNSFSHNYPLKQLPQLCYVISPVAFKN